MTAIREQIFQAVETALGAIALSPTVKRMVIGDFSEQEFPALNIDDVGQSMSEEETGVSRYALDLVVEGFVEGATGPLAHAALNELHAQVVKALRTEPLLGGLAEEVSEGATRVDVAQLADARRLAFAQDFKVIFTTVAGDPASN